MGFQLLRVLVVFVVLGAAGCTRGRSDSNECMPFETDCDNGSDETDLIGGAGGESGTRGGASGASGVSGGASGAGGSVGGASGAAGAAGMRAGAGGSGGTGTGGFAGDTGGLGGFAGDIGGMGGAGTGGGCFADGFFRVDGEVFLSGCNQCLCSNGGVTCTRIDCPTGCEVDQCFVDGICYFSGTSNILAPDDCNRCTCSDGALYCTNNEECASFCEQDACLLDSVCYADGAIGIPAGDDCNTCSCSNGDLQCTLIDCERFDEPPCEAGKCEIEGVCYPFGETTEDGCCLCEEGGVTCSDATWCDGANPIGTRCEVDGDCQPGLDCRHDLAGERGVCVRDCGFGCPEGTVCADGIPDYNGEPISNICMRTCMVSADCQSFGSQCDRPTGADRRYCF